MVNRGSKTRIHEMDRKYFREIFALNSIDDEGNTEGPNRDKLNYEGLNKIFEMVGFEPNDKQKQEFEELFAKKPLLNFNDFLSIFSLKSNSQFNEVDVKNSFRLLSKEYTREGHIKLDRVKEILNEMGLTDLEIVQLTTQLQSLCDDKGYFNFEDFVKSAF